MNKAFVPVWVTASVAWFMVDSIFVSSFEFDLCWGDDG
jgi:hypothetical protein